jgi:hypothetical protein
VAVLSRAGEWWLALVGLGVTFLVAVIGVCGLGWWVLRGDRINRSSDEGPHQPTQAEPHP